MPTPPQSRRILRRVFFGRATWLRAAVLLAAMFAVFHLLGWRDDTAIISGTFNDHDPRLTAIRGLLYAMFYFAAVVVSPILILAAGIDFLLRQVRSTSNGNEK